MKKKIIDFSEVEKIIRTHKKKNKKIVLCHGVFDLLHIGHLKHFESAKKYGNILIVSVTPDKFVNKGFNRPYFNSIFSSYRCIFPIINIFFDYLNSFFNIYFWVKKIFSQMTT